MEALRILFLPAINKVKPWIEEDKIENIKLIIRIIIKFSWKKI